MNVKKKPLEFDGIVLDKQNTQGIIDCLIDIRNSCMKTKHIGLSVPLSYAIAIINDYMKEI